jgi:hypothetical protein
MQKAMFLATLSAVLLVGASAAPAQQKEPTEVPTTSAAFDEIVQKLKTEGEAFIKADQDKGPKLSTVVKRVRYMKESARHLARALGARQEKPLMKLYITCQLLHPLKAAGNETIRPMKPVLLKLLESDCRYKPMPRWPAGALATLNPRANLPTDTLMKQMEQIQEMRRKKAAAERPVVKYNCTVREVEQAVKAALAAIGDGAADEALLKRLAMEERSRFLTFGDTLAVIRAQAGKMRQDRAKMFYKQLKSMALRVGKKRSYLDPTKPNYSVTGNSSFQTVPTYFAVATLHVVNLVATPAKEPAVPIPDVKKFEAQQK